MPAKIQFKTNIVEKYKNGESSHKIGKDEGCSYNTVLRELKRRGIDTGRFWTKEEIEKLKELYPIASREKLLKEFPNRKKESISTMAGKIGIRKIEREETCRICGGKFTIRFKQGREVCSKCVKRQWEHKYPENGGKRKKQWLQKNPEYLKQYLRRPEVRKHMNRYQRQLRKESPKYHLDCNMGVAIYGSLKSKKAGRRWETLVNYILKDLMKHLERQFDKNMTWENYGSYWHVDHIKPRSLFIYTFPEDPEFKKCWALENLQPLERIANFKKSNTFRL